MITELLLPPPDKTNPKWWIDETNAILDFLRSVEFESLSDEVVQDLQDRQVAAALAQMQSNGRPSNHDSGRIQPAIQPESRMIAAPRRNQCPHCAGVA